ncbi:helix-turn-helix domain-containing protein [Nonomuraea guangzhouensis]|uniref:Scr1 family TA system antitoxin-like transcriptional regulator n=1 Tax=Nonomuraea guangzhouensis TaxID=1291555 RepID=A0ABW4GY88_9ACTN|nr:helix-turn-helix transcriptional regulator [Nonomuraea guangzhouensis]
MDTGNSDQMSPRARFASNLEHYRKKAKLSQISLSARMRCHTSLISHVERGRRTPTLEFAEAADQAFGLDGHFAKLYRQIAHSPALGWFARWVEEIEPQAVILQSWDPLLVPGLLQTPEYARAIFSTKSPPDRAEERVQARTRRMQIFDGPTPPVFLALIEDSVLHRPIGGAEILLNQLRHLQELSQHPRITVQLVPTTAGCVAGTMSAFALARLRDGSEVVSADSVLSGQVTGDHDAVAQLKVRYDNIRADALPQTVSQQAIEDAIRKWAS